MDDNAPVMGALFSLATFHPSRPRYDGFHSMPHRDDAVCGMVRLRCAIWQFLHVPWLRYRYITTRDGMAYILYLPHQSIKSEGTPWAFKHRKATLRYKAVPPSPWLRFALYFRRATFHPSRPRYDGFHSMPHRDHAVCGMVRLRFAIWQFLHIPELRFRYITMRDGMAYILYLAHQSIKSEGTSWTFKHKKVTLRSILSESIKQSRSTHRVHAMMGFTLCHTATTLSVAWLATLSLYGSSSISPGYAIAISLCVMVWLIYFTLLIKVSNPRALRGHSHTGRSRFALYFKKVSNSHVPPIASTL